MQAVELFLLGRKLMQIAEQALPRAHVGTTARLVLVDVAFHPRSSISEITERTAFLQSHVSASVAKLRDLGVVTTETDPEDRRRTLVSVTPQALARGREVPARPLEQVLGPAVSDATDLAEVLDALELLARRLTPKVHAHLQGEAPS